MPEDTPFHDLTRYVALPRVNGLALVARRHPPRGHRRPPNQRARSTRPPSGPSIPPAPGRPGASPGRPRARGRPCSCRRVTCCSCPAAPTRPPSPTATTRPSSGSCRPTAARPARSSPVRAAWAASPRRAARTRSWSRRRCTPAPPTRTPTPPAARPARTPGVSAILHEATPVRHWDHDLGPAEPRLFATTADANADHFPALHDLTPAPGRALDDADLDLTPDGATAVVSWTVREADGYLRRELRAVDTATGEQRVLATEPDADFESPAVSPDGQLGGVRALHPQHLRRGRRGHAVAGFRSTAPPAATSPPASTAGPPSWRGRPTAPPCSSPPTRAAGRRSSASSSPTAP